MSESIASKRMRYRDSNPEDAKFFWCGGPIQVAERTWFQSMISGVTAFETDEGLLLVDTASSFLPAPIMPSTSSAKVLAGLLRTKTSAPVHTAIYTHGHRDHAFGLQEFLDSEQDPPRVVAHQAILSRFRRYERTRNYNLMVNARQFFASTSRSSAGLNVPLTPRILPDTLYDRNLTLSVGGLTFELHHCRGETDDSTWVWCPERQVLCTGDLFIWAVPNVGNPQKVQRYPEDLAKGLREMAALKARTLCPGHGGPVVNDPEKIERMLLETADYLEDIVGQTLAALEEGGPPHVDILQRVVPQTRDSPWLQPIYDEPEFIIRNTIRKYAGWWSGRPSELKPAARQALAKEIVALAGGASILNRRAKELAAAGEMRVACHLADFALEAAPEDKESQEVAAEIYELRAGSEVSLMASNLFRLAAAYAREGRPFV